MAERGVVTSSESGYSGGRGDQGGEGRFSSGAHEQDCLLPIANIGHVMMKAIPDNGKITKDAKESVQVPKTPLPGGQTPLLHEGVIDGSEWEPEQRKEGKVFSWAFRLSLLFLVANSAVAVYRARGDPWTVAFVSGVTMNLLLFLGALSEYERSPPEDASGRRRLRAAIWVLATTLNLAFAYRVASMLPPAASAAIWFVAGFVAVAGFFMLIVYRDEALANDS